MAETKLNLHPEAKAFLEDTTLLGEVFAAEKSVEALRRALVEVAKVIAVGPKDFQYDGERGELFVNSKEVEGQIAYTIHASNFHFQSVHDIFIPLTKLR